MQKWYRILILLLAWVGASACSSETSTRVPTPDYATANLDLSTPSATAHSMMIAMYRGDVKMLDAVFVESGTLRRVKPDGTVTDDGLARWRDWVETLDIGQAHEEIFNLKIEKFGNLATVWAPFVITVNGEIAGCGVNHFAMVRDGVNWRVAVGMDVQAPIERCETYKAAVMNAEKTT